MFDFEEEGVCFSRFVLSHVLFLAPLYEVNQQPCNIDEPSLIAQKSLGQEVAYVQGLSLDTAADLLYLFNSLESAKILLVRGELTHPNLD